MNTNKFISKKLVVVRSFGKIKLYKLMGGPITALQTLDCRWALYNFIENQIFGNDFVCIHYHLCKM